MIFIKMLNLSLILILCSYIGIIKSKIYENRVTELSRFRNSLAMFKSKIEFTYEPLKNIFLDISKIIYKNEKNIFEETIKKDGEIYKSWSDSVDEIKGSLNSEDKEIIKMLGKLLGKTDIKGQVNEICLTENLIEKQIEKAELEKNKNFKLYKTMGIVLGMGLCIILI